MVLVSIARRYARALLSVAESRGEADGVLAELETLAGAMAAVPDLERVFESPTFARSQRMGVAEKLAAELKLSETTGNFLRLLVDKGRTAQIPDIARIYRDLADEAAGRVRAEVVAAFPLSPETAERLAKTLSTVTGREVSVERRVDEGLLGGLIARVGDLTFDGSLKTQLKRLRETITS